MRSSKSSRLPSESRPFLRMNSTVRGTGITGYHNRRQLSYLGHRQGMVVKPDIVNRANPVTPPPVRTDEYGGVLPDPKKRGHGGRIGLHAVKIAFYRRAVIRGRDMAPLVSLQVLADINPGPGRRSELESHGRLSGAPSVSNLPAPIGIHCLGQRRCLTAC